MPRPKYYLNVQSKQPFDKLNYPCTCTVFELSMSVFPVSVEGLQLNVRGLSISYFPSGANRVAKTSAEFSLIVRPG